MITHIKTQAVYVADQESALRFYTEVLQFEVRRRESMGPGGEWIELAPPGAKSRIVLYPRALMKDWQKRTPSIVFACDDIEATYRTLADKGVTFAQAPKAMPWGKFAVFTDLDGNEFVLSEDR